MSLDLALVVFPHADGAERAYADARDRWGDEPWIDEIALVERHRHDRIIVRGTFAGRYVDVDDKADVTGKDTAVGALTGGVVGAAFGPLGIAVGLVGGATAGGIIESDKLPELHDAFFDELRADVPEGSSAVVLFAAPDHVQTMVRELESEGGETVLHHLTDDQAKALADAVSGDPDAA
jgi:uncharacterized membrane protein